MIKSGSTESSKPTRGQLERILTQRIQSLYKNELGQRPRKVTCQLLEERVIIVLEEAITPSEQLLIAAERQEFVQELRSYLDEAIKPQLIALIEEILDVAVSTLLSDTELNTGVCGVIAVLTKVPRVKNPETTSRSKTAKTVEVDNE